MRGPSIFVPVHWLTDYGGLHDNVFDTVRAFRAAAWRVVVMAPKAKFNARFRGMGAELIECDMSDASAATRMAIDRGPYHLVHAHPFQAREIGAAVACETGAKLTLTIHGQYLDDLSAEPGKYDAVIAVCEESARNILAGSRMDAHGIHVIPNGIDSETFTPRWHSLFMKIARRRKRITIVSRLDPDKVTLLHALTDLVDDLIRSGRAEHYEIYLQGDCLYGDTSSILKPLIALARRAGLTVTEAGWIPDRPSLATAFMSSDVVIASGRAAMESLACGLPTIAVASRGYVGVLRPETIEVGIRTNFGGFETELTTYRPGAISADIERAESMRWSDVLAARRRLLATHSCQTIERRQRRLAEHLMASC